MRIDLHTHSNRSDGTDSPTRLVVNAQAAGLAVIGLCDHDTFAGLDNAVAAGNRVGIRVVRGIEMSTNVGGVSVHLLGYGARPDDEILNNELAKIRESRFGRIGQMCRQLTEAGLPITEAEVLAQGDHAPSIGRPHIADVLVSKGYVPDRRTAFDEWLDEGKPGYVDRYSPRLDEAIDMLRNAGAATVIAHPWGRTSRKVLTPALLAQLQDEHQLDGIEVDHTDHDEETRELLFEMGGRLGLIRTGASDYHGAGKPDNPLGIFVTRPSALAELERRVAMRGGQI